MKKINKKVIILIDEYDIDEEKFMKYGEKRLQVDFSHLVQFENVHFILCIRPRSYKSLHDFNLLFPLDQQFQIYKNLLVRYRNAKKILEFLRFWQKNGRTGICFDMSTFPNITREEILDEENLPPLLENQEHGVIWIPLKKESKTEIIVNTIKKIVENFEGILSLAVLYHRIGCSRKVAEEIKNICQDFHGPYEENHFNGKEAEIVVYITSSVNGLYIQSLARARRLLILVTHDPFWGDHIMNKAVKKNLVKKVLINEE